MATTSLASFPRYPKELSCGRDRHMLGYTAKSKAKLLLELTDKTRNSLKTVL